VVFPASAGYFINTGNFLLWIFFRCTFKISSMTTSKNQKNVSCAAVIAAGGSGTRMAGPVRKQFIELGGRSILRRCVDLFLSLEEIGKIVVVLPADAVGEFTASLQPGEEGLIQAVGGGATRQESVYNGLKALDPDRIRVVAIHDAARPLVSPDVVRRTLELAAEGTAAVACARVRDTVKRAKDGFVEATVERGNLWLAQTPQSFPLKMILEAHQAAARDGFTGTDDVSLCERLAERVRIVESDAGNIKVTEQSDLEYFQYRLKGDEMAGDEPGSTLRIGEGFDVHPLAGGRRLVIGGVEIPFEKGLAGHSDADVLLHAVTDALLGAAALGDIGRSFPDDDPAFKDADSVALLSQVVEKLKRKGFHPVNLDATVIAQKPRLAPYMKRIGDNIAGILGVDIDRVNVKAKTHEGLGALGRGEGIAARAAVLVKAEK